MAFTSQISGHTAHFQLQTALQEPNYMLQELAKVGGVPGHAPFPMRQGGAAGTSLPGRRSLSSALLPRPQISEEDGVLTRTFLSPAHIRAAEQVQAGCGFRHPKREVLGRSGLPSRRGASWQCMRLLPGRMYGLPGCWHANVAPPPSAVSHGPVTASDRLCSRADTATGASPRDLSPNPRSSKTGWPALG